MAGKILLGAAAILFAILFAFFYYLNSRGVSPEELARRCANARPAWQSYQEDIKAQVGAGPVAAWRGEPVSAEFTPGAVLVVFELEGEWAVRDAALPVLLRTPGGAVLKGSAEGDARRTYLFALPPDEPEVAWAQVRYPHASKRILPGESGVWHTD